MTIPFPPYRPTSWELQLPNYRVITNSWRSTEIPEILGSLPEDARLRLRYENITDQQALELLLLWRATAGGYYPLDPLPAEVAAGINDAALADRILNIAPLSWVVADPQRQESIKNLRSGLDIELKSELRFVPSIAIPTITCPVYVPRQYSGCIGAPPGSVETPGITFSGTIDPDGPNLVCVTYAAVDITLRNTEDDEPSLLEATTYNCAIVNGPFTVYFKCGSGGLDFGVEFCSGGGVQVAEIGDPVGQNLTTGLGTSQAGTKIVNPVFEFTVTPVGGDPANYISTNDANIVFVQDFAGGSFDYPGVTLTF